MRGSAAAVAEPLSRSNPQQGDRAAVPLERFPGSFVGEPIFRVVLQREAADCTVACLAMVAGVGYDSAREAIRAVGGRPRRGTYRLCVAERAAALLGMPLVRRRMKTYDPRSVVGIVCMRGPRKAHAAVFCRGLVFDTDGHIWFVDDFLTHWEPQGRPCTLLEVDLP